MADLLPCPFCGGTDAHSVGDAILCDGCEALGPYGYAEDDDRARWNTRAPNPRLDKARALLTECAAEVEARGVDPSLAAAVREWLEVPHG